MTDEAQTAALPAPAETVNWFGSSYNPFTDWIRFNFCLAEMSRKLFLASFFAFMPRDLDTMKVEAQGGEEDSASEKKKDRDKKEKDKAQEKEVDEALEESFPASDPPNYNPGTAHPTE